jgi:hypothetical protein
MSFARCADCTVRHLNRRLSFCQNEAVPSQLIRLTGWSSVPGKKPACPFRYTRTCSAMPVATRWRTPVTIPARCRITSDTRISSTQYDILSCRQRVSRNFGGSKTGLHSPAARREQAFPGRLAYWIRGIRPEKTRAFPTGARPLVTTAFAAATSNPGLSPLDFFLAVMRDPSIPPDWRFRAAQSAAPYVHPKPERAQAVDSAATTKQIEGPREDPLFAAFEAYERVEDERIERIRIERSQKAKTDRELP